MLFESFSQIQFDPFRGIVTFATFSLALVLAITVHEFSHALIATRLGDPTSKRLGRLSLNPRAHLDPVGSMMIILAGFGWGKPVPVNPDYLRTGARSGMAVVSLAGPISKRSIGVGLRSLHKGGSCRLTFCWLFLVPRRHRRYTRVHYRCRGILEPAAGRIQPDTNCAARRIQGSAGDIAARYG